MTRCCICGKRYDEIEAMLNDVFECDCGGGLVPDDESFGIYYE